MLVIDIRIIRDLVYWFALSVGHMVLPESMGMCLTNSNFGFTSHLNDHEINRLGFAEL